MKRYDSSGKLIPIVKMKKGDKVEVLEGPFANFIATVEKYESNRSHMGFNGFNGQEDKNTNSF